MSTFEILQESEKAILRGDFVILFRHGNWYLIGTRRSNSGRRIKSVYVMSSVRAKATISETPSAIPQNYDEFGEDFFEEIKSKFYQLLKITLHFLGLVLLDCQLVFIQIQCGR